MQDPQLIPPFPFQSPQLPNLQLSQPPILS